MQHVHGLAGKLAFSLFVGNSLITAEHDGHPRREVVRHAVDRLLSSSWP